MKYFAMKYLNMKHLNTKHLNMSGVFFAFSVMSIFVVEHLWWSNTLITTTIDNSDQVPHAVLISGFEMQTRESKSDDDV